MYPPGPFWRTTTLTDATLPHHTVTGMHAGRRRHTTWSWAFQTRCGLARLCVCEVWVCVCVWGVPALGEEGGGE